MYNCQITMCMAIHIDMYSTTGVAQRTSATRGMQRAKMTGTTGYVCMLIKRLYKRCRTIKRTPQELYVHQKTLEAL